MVKLAKTKARKMREHIVRQGKTNPADYRGSWNGVVPLTKTTPTIKEKKEKERNKYKPNLHQYCS
jgi:hypothetical protein